MSGVQEYLGTLFLLASLAVTQTALEFVCFKKERK